MTFVVTLRVFESNQDPITNLEAQFRRQMAG